MVRKTLREFKAFAMQGNMLDIAVGIVMGVAFKGVIDALTDHVINGFIGAVFGTPNFNEKVFHLGHGKIEYGYLITAIINFLLVALALFGVVKLLSTLRIARIRAQGTRECPYCRSYIPVDALKCMYCTSEVVPVLLDDDPDHGSTASAAT